MVKYLGTALNIDRPFIAKVTTRPLMSRVRHHSVLVGKELPKILKGHQAIICSQNYAPESFLKVSVPIVYGVSGINGLDEDDVVLIEPSGLVNILYKKASNDNALVLTLACNAECIMCPQPGYEIREGRAGLNEVLIKLIDKETKALGITGGEPTLAKDELLKTIQACKKYLPYTEVDLLTNGILLEDFEYVKALVSIGHPNLFFQIPLYAATDREHDQIMGREGFHKTINGIYNLALFHQKVEIRTVIFSLTYKRLPQLTEFIYRNFPFVIHVALMGLEVTHKAQENINQLWIDPYHYQDGLLRAVQILHRANLNVSVYNHQLCVIHQSLWPFAKISISDWKRVYPELCRECKVKDLCGGVFATSGKWYSQYLQSVKIDRASIGIGGDL